MAPPLDSGDAPLGARERRLDWLAFGLYIALSLVKMRAYLVSGRFWAEEGMVFFARIKPLPFWKALYFQYNGHLELATNLIAAIASWVPFKYAPLVTSYLSFAAQSIPVAYLVHHRSRFGLSRSALCGLCVLIVGLPEAAEVWANAINLHFHFALLAGLIAGLNARGEALTPGTSVLLALCGLSGIPANFLVPVFLALALASRDPARLRQAAVLSATALLQLVLLLGNRFEVGERDFRANPLYYALAVLSHQWITPAVGYDAGDQLAATLRLAPEGDRGAIALAVSCGVPVLWLTWRLVRGGSTQQRVLLAASVLLMTLGLVTSTGNRALMVGAIAGGRYFFASDTLLAVCLMATATRAPARWLRLLPLPLVIAAGARVDFYLRGPDWRDRYAAAVAAHAEQIEIWPSSRWTVPNFDRRE
jgi:hypothetical protein